MGTYSDQADAIITLRKENATLKERVVTLEKLQGVALIETLRAEVERLKEVGECHAIDLRERDAAIRSHCDKKGELRQQLAASQIEAKRLRDTMQKIAGHPEETPPFYWWQIYARKALSSPTSTDALDAYVAEKVKEETDECTALNDRLAKLLAETAVALKGEEAALTRHSWHDLPIIALAKMVEISELIRQRDLAVSALGFAQEKIAELHIEAGDGDCHYPLIDDALAAIKESES